MGGKGPGLWFSVFCRLLLPLYIGPFRCCTNRWSIRVGFLKTRPCLRTVSMGLQAVCSSCGALRRYGRASYGDLRLVHLRSQRQYSQLETYVVFGFFGHSIGIYEHRGKHFVQGLNLRLKRDFSPNKGMFCYKKDNYSMSF